MLCNEPAYTIAIFFFFLQWTHLLFNNSNFFYFIFYFYFILHKYIYFHTKNITTNYLLHLFDCTYNIDNKIFELLTKQYLHYLQYTKYTKLPIHALLYNMTWQNKTTFLKLHIHIYKFILSWIANKIEKSTSLKKENYIIILFFKLVKCSVSYFKFSLTLNLCKSGCIWSLLQSHHTIAIC